MLRGGQEAAVLKAYADEDAAVVRSARSAACKRGLQDVGAADVPVMKRVHQRTRSYCAALLSLP